MKYLLIMVVLFSICNGDKIDLGKWDTKGFSSFLLETSNNNQTEKIKNISNEFLNTPYKANTMIGSIDKKEELVIDLGGVDCFTFVDYIQALKHSNSFDTFKSNLINLRYQNGKIEYTKRNHFFFDWIIYNNFENITSSLSSKAKQVIKTLNLSKQNKPFLKGIKTKRRVIEYIDSKDLNSEIINKLHTGDYIGIYTDIQGLDVTHVGLFINKNGKAYFRHASSNKKYLKVVDTPFESYIKNTPGFIVLREKN